MTSRQTRRAASSAAVATGWRLSEPDDDGPDGFLAYRGIVRSERLDEHSGLRVGGLTTRRVQHRAPRTARGDPQPGSKQPFPGGRIPENRRAHRRAQPARCLPARETEARSPRARPGCPARSEPATPRRPRRPEPSHAPDAPRRLACVGIVEEEQRAQQLRGGVLIELARQRAPQIRQQRGHPGDPGNARRHGADGGVLMCERGAQLLERRRVQLVRQERNRCRASAPRSPRPSSAVLLDSLGRHGKQQRCGPRHDPSRQHHHSHDLTLGATPEWTNDCRGTRGFVKRERTIALFSNHV